MSMEEVGAYQKGYNHGSREQKVNNIVLVLSKGCIGTTHCGIEVHDNRCPINLAEEIRSQP